jgi:hypothetical protein
MENCKDKGETIPMIKGKTVIIKGENSNNKWKNCNGNGENATIKGGKLQ